MTAVSFRIEGGDYEHGGSASRSVKEQLKKIGADPAVVRRAMIAAYEAEMNVVIHAHRGELRARIDDGALHIEVIDEGPGIPDLGQAMKPGFSTASAKARELGFGAGMGLPNIKKNSDEFTIQSEPGRGTRLALRIDLKPRALYGAGRHSIELAADRCNACLACVHACPTQALRVFRGKPLILDYLCVDCGACLAVCPQRALTMAPTADLRTADPDPVLILAPPMLGQFGAGAGPARVLEELTHLGFQTVLTTSEWETALRDAVVASAAGAPGLPVISPACPAVVNLIEMRFPSLLPQLAPLSSAFEAAVRDSTGRTTFAVVACPAQRTVLRGAALPPSSAALSIVSPATLREKLLPRLAQRRPTAGADLPTHPQQPADSLLVVTGIANVLRLLEAIEDGNVPDVRVVEPWACPDGCWGSPLLPELAALARARAAGVVLPAGPAARAVPRSAPYAPRPGLRLDSDMAKAIQKLARIDKLTRSLPGANCAQCGAPSCAALAEDIVLGRAHLDACPRQHDSSAPENTHETG